MPKNDPQPDRRLLQLCLAGIAAITLWRIALLPFSTAELFVDEAQYWFWGQELDWGYYSKPPLIGWLLRLSTTIGTDSPFWIHVPLAIIHAGTALLVMATGRQLLGARVGSLAGLAFATLPGVALASLLVSTDTPMLFFFALALLAFVKLGKKPSTAWAVAMGAAIGLGLMSKYAMIYFPVSAALCAFLLPSARISWRDAGIAAVVALIVISPNIWWNLSNDLTTLQHTADNADYRGLQLEFGKLLEFWGGQFAVSGPVLFAAFLVALRTASRRPETAFLALMALPTLVIVSVQAVLSGANANWAAAGHIAAVLLGMSLLVRFPAWLKASFAVNGVLCIALPVLVIFADSLRIGSGNLLMDRYIGMRAVSERAATIAEREGLDTLVSENRAILADFFYTLKGSDLALYSEPPEGFPKHHYAQSHPLPREGGEVLYISKKAKPPARCAEAEPIETWEATEGFFVGTLGAFRLPRSCWFDE
ncbi:ArnT family glycosyltransferase [Amaricoccus macauensis]|uniref:ArnT family glycosyltransferase n=1 Tax=Amaricoccus macauensis TaxID=57001 RepID=UPI003C7E1DCB